MAYDKICKQRQGSQYC